MLQRGFTVSNDNHWDVCSTGLVDREYGPTVIVPVTQLDGMSDEEIGQTVRALEYEARKCDALEIADWVDREDLDYWRASTLVQWYGELLPFADDPIIAEAIATLKGENEPPGWRPQRSTLKPKRDTTGHIYLIRCGKHYKIGMTKDLKRRLTQFSTKLPLEPELVCSFPCPDMYAREKELHENFANKRTNGEWFALDPSDVEYFRGLGVTCE